MKLLIVVSNPKSRAALSGLLGACIRRKLAFACFFTGDGVTLLDDAGLVSELGNAARAVVCEHSWQQYSPDRPAPIEQGSQTDHSALMGEVSHVVSF